MNFKKPYNYIDYSSPYSEISYKIYGEHSNSLDSLDISFNPYANHILNFIKNWVMVNVEYGYEIVSCKRSWYSQKKVTTIYDDNKNGLSWYLYGNAISINVFKKINDQLFEGGSSEDYIKQPLSFIDGSAKTFIVEAQKWFVSNPINIDGSDRVLKIFGIYPSIKECINASIIELSAQYKNDPDVVYWGGLFSGHSNFTHWEWHPGYLPNEIWKKREIFLNECFSELDIVEIISSEKQNSTFEKIYLKNNVELLEEDFLSLISLKMNINLSKEYTIVDMLQWVTKNPASVSQMIKYFQVVGDYNNTALLKTISSVSRSATIQYDSNNNPILLGTNDLLRLVSSDDGSFSFEFYNEFSEKITVGGDYSLILPVDSKLLEDEFDVIDLTIEDVVFDTYSETLTEVSTKQIIDNISSSANVNSNVMFDINEHGMLDNISIDPSRILGNIEDIEKNILGQMVFEEMITPPNQVIITKTKTPKVLDISKINNNDASIKNNLDEMLTPNML